MSINTFPEYWLRGPVDAVPALLQPAAHALLQARAEINEMLQAFPQEKLWQKPYGLASVAFHLQHLAGVLDRLFTYADGKQLTEVQLQYLAAEGVENKEDTLATLLDNFNRQVELSVSQLKQTNIATLTHTRGVGRKQIPSTVIGLLFHATEHTMRHTGQLLVTTRLLQAQN